MDGLSHNNISMETLQTSIVNAIKAIRSSKKRADELTVCKFVKKELHLITNTDVNKTLKILIEVGRIINKPSKDNTNNAYKYAKYKKIKDVLLPEIKNDTRDFTQNEVKQKTNLHNQEEYQTVVDKKLITNLEREIEFLKSEISIKNEIIKKLLNNDIRQNKNCNMVGETWNFDVTHETSDCESTCSISNSEDSIVESRDVNTLNTKSSGMSIDDQLKTIRKEKHQEYLLNTGCKSPSSENTKNNKNAKQFSDQQAKKENINEAEETNKEFHWPLGTCGIVGDSMVNGIDKKRLQKHGNVKVFYFSGARINDMNHTT